MQISVESGEGLERRMTVELPAERVNQEIEKRLQRLAKTAKIDGFRPGKVPLSVVRKRYAEQVRGEVFGELVQGNVALHSSGRSCESPGPRRNGPVCVPGDPPERPR